MPSSRGSSWPQGSNQGFLYLQAESLPLHHLGSFDCLVVKIKGIEFTNADIIYCHLQTKQFIPPKWTRQFKEKDKYVLLMLQIKWNTHTHKSQVLHFYTKIVKVYCILEGHSSEKAMATHSSVLAWRFPWTGEPGGLPSMGSHSVGHDWSDLAAAVAAEDHW